MWISFLQVEHWRAQIVLPEYDEDEMWQREHAKEWLLARSEAHYSLALCYDSGYGVGGINRSEAFLHYEVRPSLTCRNECRLVRTTREP